MMKWWCIGFTNRIESVLKSECLNQLIGYVLQHFRFQYWGFVLVLWWAVWLCSGVLGMSAGWMMFSLKEKTERCPVSAPWTLLNLWGEIDVDSIPVFLFLCLSIDPNLCLTLFLFQFHPWLTFPQFSSWSLCLTYPSMFLWMFLSSLPISASLNSLCLSSFSLYVLRSLPPSLPAVRSWALRSESGWQVLVVRAWRAGRHPSMNANAVPPATMCAVLMGWWVGAQPKYRKAGASMIGRGLGRRWGWRARLALLSQMVSGTMCVCPSYSKWKPLNQQNIWQLFLFSTYTNSISFLKPQWPASRTITANTCQVANICLNPQKCILYLGCNLEKLPNPNMSGWFFEKCL